MIFGTPEYMSPEQAQGHPPDHRVDVYAVGCIMYHMLTGAVPFTADSFMGILTKHLLEPVVPPRKRRPELDIPADVEAVCLRAMEKDRDKRWSDMDAFYQALGAAGGVPFEPSNVFVPPQASLKYPRLTEANAERAPLEDRDLGVAAGRERSRTSGLSAPRAPPATGAGPSSGSASPGPSPWCSRWCWRCAVDTRRAAETRRRDAAPRSACKADRRGRDGDAGPRRGSPGAAPAVRGAPAARTEPTAAPPRPRRRPRARTTDHEGAETKADPLHRRSTCRASRHPPS